jgi:hypothetical protein
MTRPRIGSEWLGSGGPSSDVGQSFLGDRRSLNLVLGHAKPLTGRKEPESLGDERLRPERRGDAGTTSRPSEIEANRNGLNGICCSAAS